MKVTRIRIGLLQPGTVRLQPQEETPPDDVNHYWAEAIKDGDKYCYRVSLTTVEITEGEYCRVIRNPSLYYFSTALSLHKRIELVKKDIYGGRCTMNLPDLYDSAAKGDTQSELGRLGRCWFY